MANGKADLKFMIEIGVITPGQGKRIGKVIGELEKAEKRLAGLNASRAQALKQVEAANNKLAASSEKLKAAESARVALQKRSNAANKEQEASLKAVQKTMEALGDQQAKLGLEIRKANEKANAAGVSDAEKNKQLQIIEKKTEEIQALGMAYTEAAKKEQELLNQDRKLTAEQKKANAELGRKIGGLKTAFNKAKKGAKEVGTSLKNLTVDQRAAAKEVTELERKIGRSSTAFREFQKRIKQLGGVTDGTEKDIRDLAKTLRETGQIDVLRKASKGMENLQKKVAGAKVGMKGFAASAQKSLSGVGRTVKRIITTLVTLSGLLLFKNLIRQGIEFEAAMVRVGAIAGATGKQLKVLVGTVREIARETIFTASQVSDVTRILAQSGFTTTEIMDSLNGVLQLTAATMGELGQTTELVVSILRAFNLAATETENVANILTEATVSSRASIERLSVSFRFGGPAAAAFNQSIETTTATLSRLIDLGLSASIAGTTLRRALIELGAGSARQVKVLRSINVALEEVNPSFNDLGDVLRRLAQTTLTADQAIQLFGARAGASMFALIRRIREGGEGISEFAKQLRKATELNRVERIFTKLATTVRAQSLITKSALEDLGLTLFSVFRPALTQIIQRARDAFIELNASLEKNTGKNFQKTLLKLLPLFDALVGSLILVVQIFGFALVAIAEVINKFPYLTVVIKIATAVLAILAVKMIFTTTLFTAFGIAAKGAGRQVLALALKIPIVSTALGTASVAVKAFWASLGPVGWVILGVTTAITIAAFAFSKFRKAANDSTKGVAKGLDQIGEAANFAEGSVRKISEQTKIQIADAAELNELLVQRKIIMATTDNGSGFLATSFEAPDLKIAFAAENFTDQVSTAESAIKNLGGIGVEVGETIGNSLADTINEIPGLIENALALSYEEVKTFAELSYEELFKLHEQTNFQLKGEGELEAYMEQVEKARKISRKIPYDQLIKPDSVPDFEVTIIPTNFKETAKQVVEQTQKLTEDINKNFKDAKTGEVFVSELVNRINKGDLDKALTKNFDNFTREGQTYARSLAKSLKIPFDSFTKGNLLKLLQGARKIAIGLESARKGAAEAVSQKYKAVLGGLLKQNEALTRSKEQIKIILADQDGLIKAQNLLDKLKRQEVANRDKLKETNDRIINQENEILKLGVDIKKIEKEGGKDAKDKANTKRAEILIIEQSIGAERGLLNEAMATNNEYSSQISTLERRTAEIELSRVKEEEAAAEAALIKAQMGAVNREIQREKKLLADSNKLMADFDSEAVGSTLSVKSLGVQLKSIQDQMSFRKAFEEIQNISEQIKIQKKEGTEYVKIKTQRLALEQKLEAKLLAIGKTTKDVLNSDQEIAAVRKVDKTAAELILKVRKAMNAEQVAGLEITKNEQKRREKLLEIENKIRGVIAESKRDFEVLFGLDRANAAEDVNVKYKERNVFLQNGIKKLEKANKALGLNENAVKKNNALIKQQGDAIEQNNKSREKALLLLKDKQVIERESALASVLSSAGLSEEAKGITHLINLRKGEIAVQKEIEKLQAEADKAKGKIKVGGLSGEEIKQNQKIIQQTDERINRLRATKKLMEDLRSADPYVVLGASAKIMTKNLFDGFKMVEAVKTSVSEMGGLLKSFVGDLIDTEIDSWFGLGEQNEDAKKLKKIADDLAKNLLDIERKLQEQLLKIREDALQKLLKLELDHRQKVAEINSDFDRERRDVEGEIFNERVARLQELAALEQQLRFQGLTDEQQRADLLSTIDESLATARLGSIEERQIKLTELEEQIKALNTLENNLGLSREQIDQSSLERLGQLKTETSAFFNDKQRLAVEELEGNRTRELAAQAQLFKDQKALLDQETKLAMDRANREAKQAELDAIQKAAEAKKTIEAEKEKNKSLAQLGADLTKATLKGMGKIVLAKLFEKRIDSLLTNSKISNDQKEQASSIATATVDVGTSQAKAAGSVTEKLISTLGPFGIPLAIAAIAGIVALFSGIFSMIKRNGGGVIEKAFEKGGIITGGKGGVDDIHTKLPVGAYVVNKRSTQKHQSELSRMTSARGVADRQRQQVPVAVTAGEFLIPPEVYRNNTDRIQEINSDKSGSTAENQSYYGGYIRGYQFGGGVTPASSGQTVESREITIHNTLNFSGVNAFGSDDQEAIATIYNGGLRDRIQEDLDNNAFA